MSDHEGVLVTGAPRSGTTWVGKMLALAPGTRYLHEPFNGRFATEAFHEEPFPHWYMYIDDFNEPEYLDKVARMLALPPAPPRPGFPVVKDPIAIFSAPWLYRRFDLAVIFMVRHPAAFVRSILELGWDARPRHFLDQRPLMENWLHPLEPELRRQLARTDDPLGDAALTWKALHFAAAQFLDRHPHWLLIRHEDLATDPASGFERLYHWLGLDYHHPIRQGRLARLSRRLGLGLFFRATVATAIANHSKARNPTSPKAHWEIRRNSRATITTWHHYFSADQLARIRDIVEPVAGRFYSDAEWNPGSS